MGTSDGSLQNLGLVVLEDDRDWQNAENLVPVVNTEFLDAHPDVADALNKLSDTLTEDLMTLNAKVDSERMLPEDVASGLPDPEGPHLTRRIPTRSGRRPSRPAPEPRQGAAGRRPEGRLPGPEGVHPFRPASRTLVGSRVRETDRAAEAERTAGAKGDAWVRQPGAASSTSAGRSPGPTRVPLWRKGCAGSGAWPSPGPVESIGPRGGARPVEPAVSGDEAHCGARGTAAAGRARGPGLRGPARPDARVTRGTGRCARSRLWAMPAPA